MHQHFHDDIERQREALTGLAVAEGDEYFSLVPPQPQFSAASRLLNYRSIPGDQYARLTATEAAAHTASFIFYQVCLLVHDKAMRSERSIYTDSQ